MSLINFIEKIQNRPPQSRDRILWLCVFVCMLIVFSIWLASAKRTYSIPNKENNKEDKKILQSFKEIKKNIPSATDSLKANINSLFNNEAIDSNQVIDSEDEQMEKYFIEDVEEKIIKPSILPTNE